MKNYGLSDYSALIRKKFCDFNIFLNIIKETANYNYLFKAYKSRYNRGQNIYLLYNHHNMFTDYGFGKGVKLNTDFRLLQGDNKFDYYYETPLGEKYGFTMINKNESIFYYLYENKELNMKLSVYRDQYNLYLKNGTVINLVSLGGYMGIKEIRYLDGSKFILNYDTQNRLIQIINNANKKEKVVFDYDSFDYVLISVFKENSSTISVSRNIANIKIYKQNTGTFAGFINRIIINKGELSNSIYKDYSFTYYATGSGLQTYQIINNKTTLKCEYIINANNQSLQFIDEFNRVENYTYLSKYQTSIKDANNNIKKIYVNENYMLMNLIDESKKTVKFFKFNQNNKIELISKKISFDSINNGEKLELINSFNSNFDSINIVDKPLFLKDINQSAKCLNFKTSNDAKYVQIYEFNGKKFDNITATIWTKLNQISNDNNMISFNIYLCDNLDNYKSCENISNTDVIHNKEGFLDYQFNLVIAHARHNFKYVVFEIDANGTDFDFNCIVDLYKVPLADLFYYDTCNNVVKVLQNGLFHNFIYNDDKSLSSSSYGNNFYNSSKKIVASINQYGLKTIYEYDQYNNLTKEVVTNGTYDIVYEDSYLDNEALLDSIDARGLTKKRFYNDLYSLKKEYFLSNSGMNICEIYDYKNNDHTKVSKKTYKEESSETSGVTNVLSVIEYDYNNSNDISSIDHNSKQLAINYDSHVRDIQLLLNGSLFLSKQYQNNLLYGVLFGNKDGYVFGYDQYNRVTSMSYINNELSENAPLFTIEYDEFDRVVTINEHNNLLQKNYKYNDYGKIKEYSYLDYIEENIYDYNNYLAVKKYKISDNYLLFSKQFVDKLLSIEYENYKSDLRNSSNFLLCAFDDISIAYDSNENPSSSKIVYDTKIKLLNSANKICINQVSSDDNTLSCYVDGMLTGFNFDGVNSLKFSDTKLNNTKFISFSFKLSSSYGELIRIGDNNNNLSIKIDSLNKISIYNNDEAVILNQNIYIELNKWYFVAFVFDKTNTLLKIHINDMEYIFYNNFTYENCLFIEIGKGLIGKIFNLVLSFDNIDSNIIKKLCLSNKFLLLSNSSKKSNNNKIEKKSITQEIRNYNMNIIPLNNGTIGITNDYSCFKPVIEEVLDLYGVPNKNCQFIYNDSLENYAYYSSGQKLIYETNISKSGTVIFNLNRLDVSGDCYVFELFDNNDDFISLQINENNIEIEFLNKILSCPTPQSLKNINSWNIVCLKWDKLISSDSLGIEYKVEFVVNNVKLLSTHVSSLIDFYSNLNISIGKAIKNISCVEKKLNGLVECVLFNNLFYSDTSLFELIDSIKKPTKTVNHFNDFNLIKDKKIVDSGNTVLLNQYDYKTGTINEDTNNIRLYPIVVNEVINNSTYNYTYDERGNLLCIKKDNDIIETYSYDNLGRLLSENNEFINYKYEYDSNGNICKVINLVNNIIIDDYLYNQDKLIEFNNNEVVYEENNSMYPKNICGNVASFKGNKLDKYYCYETSKWSYNNYDSRGLIVYKKVLNNTELVEDEVYYYYDIYGNLINLKSNNYTLSFIYDDNNQLYGFIHNDNKYYYMKNLFNSILGIVDKQGNKIVEYKYDAWGNILDVEDLSGCELARINPFRYKNYIYDEVMQLYYCKSRFYSSKLRRWISPDNPNNLSVDNTQNLNLFAYCLNNPVSYFDDFGLFPKKIDISPYDYRIDVKKQTNTRHIHIYKKNNKNNDFVQNEDGSIHDKLTSYDYNPPRWVQKKLRENGVWDWKSFKISSHAIELPNFVPTPGNQESAEVEVFPDVKVTDDAIIEEPFEEPVPPVIFIPDYHEEAVFEHIPSGGLDYGGVIAIGLCAVALALCGGGNLGLCFTQEYSVRSFL